MTFSDIVSRSISSANRSWRAIIVVYVSTLLLAAVAAFGVQSALFSGFKDSMLPETLLEGFNTTVFDDLARAQEGFLGPVLAQLPWLLIFWLVLNTLLGGGMVAALKRGSSDSFAEFFSDCGAYLGRMFLLLLVSAFLLLIFGTVWMMVVGVLYAAMTSGSITEIPNVVGAIVAATVFLLPMILIMMVIDYTRVQIVVDDSASVLSAAWQSTKFAFRHFFSTFGWQLLMLLMLLALAALYWLISDTFSMETGWGIFLVFLLQQISVASRIWGRLVMVGGQIQLNESQGVSVTMTGTLGFVPPVAAPLPPVPTVPVKAVVSKKRTVARRGTKSGKRKHRS